MKVLSTIMVLITLLLSNCKTIQNSNEKIIVGSWLQDLGSNDENKWIFSKNGTVEFYHNNILTNSYYYSILDYCPKECIKHKSKWEINHYLYLISIKDSSRIKCYEILFEQNKDISLRYLPLEKDTYYILKRIKN